MSARRLRVLIVSPSLPYPPSWGFGIRVFQLARGLAAHHDVTILSYGGPEQAEDVELLRQECGEVCVVPWQPPTARARRAGQLRSLVSKSPFHARELKTSRLQVAIDAMRTGPAFDIAQIESSQLGHLRFSPGTAVILDEHNIEYELLERMSENECSPARRLYNGVEYRKLRRLERRWWNDVDACVVTSEREAMVVREHAPTTPTEVVPNAVDLVQFSPTGTTPEPKTLVFTGLLAYRPNLDAAEFLVKEVMPRLEKAAPGVSLTIVGHGPAADLEGLRRPNVLVTGWVPDVRPFVAPAAVVVAPLRIGSGTRLKVLEALAMGKAVVSTRVGCEGLDVRDGVHLVMADGADHLATAIASLLTDHGRARALGDAGRQLVVSRYSWEHAGARLEELYQDLASPRGQRDAG